MSGTTESVSEVVRRFYIVGAPKNMTMGDLERKIGECVTESNTTDRMLGDIERGEELLLLAETGDYQLLAAGYHDVDTGRMFRKYAREFHLFFEGRLKDFTLIEDYFRKTGMNIYRARTCGNDTKFESLSSNSYHKKSTSEVIGKIFSSELIGAMFGVGIICATIGGAFYCSNALYRSVESGDGFFQTVNGDFFGKDTSEAGR